MQSTKLIVVETIYQPPNQSDILKLKTLVLVNSIQRGMAF